MFECKLKLKIKRNLILRKASNGDNKTSTQQILGKRREELQGAELYIYIYIHDLNAYKVDGTIKGWKANKLKRTAIKINELPVPPKGI